MIFFVCVCVIFSFFMVTLQIFNHLFFLSLSLLFLGLMGQTPKSNGVKKEAVVF